VNRRNDGWVERGMWLVVVGDVGRDVWESGVADERKVTPGVEGAGGSGLRS